MRLKISHLTEYRYDGPTQFSLQRLRLTPPTSPAQKVLGWALNVEGATPEVEYDDQYGNHVNLVSLEGEQYVTRILAEGEVETEDNNGVTGPHAGFCPLWLFLRDTPLTKGGKLVKELIKGVGGDNEGRAAGCLGGDTGLAGPRRQPDRRFKPSRKRDCGTAGITPAHASHPLR